MFRQLTAIAALVASARSQQACSLTTETHPPLSWSKCAAGGSCSTVSGSVTIDANWRWLHQTSSSTNCYTGNKWDTSICSTNTACASACCVDGADYASTYGATTSGNALNLKFVTQGAYSKNIGSRMYLMESDTKYQMFNLLGQEFTFDVDVSNLGVRTTSSLLPTVHSLRILAHVTVSAASTERYILCPWMPTAVCPSTRVTRQAPSTGPDTATLNALAI